MATTNPTTQHLRNIVVQLLIDHPAGLDTAELNALVQAVEPDLPKPVIRHAVFGLEYRAADTFQLKKDGRIALVPALAAAFAPAPKGGLGKSTTSLADSLIAGA